ncbi:MAG TPA: tetratricopeptide repeat protein [Kribbella sp.]|uniref:tetratricopeptide repeat protein n=1 Tax=Kribbella sp. TaxID=1871183 RepID=UPI002D76B490|nr:tetratricopeptide repeat protein [Kribbella sp.]HET6293457.1 tetratricopeptide repeat protein [Kribbella sp.]
MDELDSTLRHFVEEIRLLVERDPIEGFRRWSALHTELAQLGQFELCDDMLRELKGMDLPGYGLGIVRYAEGWTLDRSGEWEPAIERYQAALSAFQDAELPLDVQILTQIGSLYQDQGHYPEAQDAYEQAFESADEHGRALLMNNLGGLCALRDQPDEARVHFENARTLLEGTDDKCNLAAVLVGLASLAQDRGELNDAVQHLARAIVIFRDLRRPTAMAAAVASLALTYHRAGEYTVAADTYRTALEYFVAYKDRANIARTLANMALTSVAAGKKDEAIGYLQQAVAEYREIGDAHGEQIALDNLRQLGS